MYIYIGHALASRGTSVIIIIIIIISRDMNLLMIFSISLII
jgi:hypothetical protein